MYVYVSIDDFHTNHFHKDSNPILPLNFTKKSHWVSPMKSNFLISFESNCNPMTSPSNPILIPDEITNFWMIFPNMVVSVSS